MTKFIYKDGYAVRESRAEVPEEDYVTIEMKYVSDKE